MKALVCIVAIAVIMCTNTAYAADEVTYKGTGKDTDAEIDVSHKSIFGLELGFATLDEIKEVLGNATAHVSEDRHEPDTYCYSSAVEDDDTVVIIESGPRCGPSREFAGFTIASRNKAEMNNMGECISSPLVNNETSTGSGIRVGINREQLIEILGEPTEINGDVFRYTYDTKIQFTHDEIELLKTKFKYPNPSKDAYLYAWVEAVFDGDLLIKLTVHEVEDH